MRHGRALARVEAWEIRAFVRAGRIAEATVSSFSTAVDDVHDSLHSLDFSYPDPLGVRVHCSVRHQSHVGDPVVAAHYGDLCETGASYLVCHDPARPALFYEDPYIHLVGRPSYPARPRQRASSSIWSQWPEPPGVYGSGP